MTDSVRAYGPDDFLRVRDFLVDTCRSFDLPVNWGLERWNYARYFVAPMLGSYGDETQSVEGSLAAIKMWEEMVGVWERDGEIAGVTCIEHPDPTHPGYGEIFIQRHPDHLDLLEGMVAFAEKRYANPETGRAHIWICDGDRDLTETVTDRGFIHDPEKAFLGQELLIDELPKVGLPPGFTIMSMAEECDVEKRRELFGRAFDHPEAKEWPSTFAYQELMRALDYRKDQDIFIKAEDGTYASCAIVWYDSKNRIGRMEPVGTRPEYRGLGLGRAIVYAALHKMKALGATVTPMDGGNAPFYEAIGYKTVRRWTLWKK